ncbi:MAG: hypothetical protein D6722_12060 [Bacteroidetes bacterium]|nr:MAG: hypothetical protein D6722_12060 [Bacteroidota bacterium]
MLERSYGTELDNILTDIQWNFSTLNIGGYYVLAHHKDVVSVGVDPSVQIGLSFPAGPGVNIMVQTPVYLMARVGANSTPYNQQALGLSVGVGGNLQYLTFTGLNRRTTFFAPGAVVEGTLSSRGAPLTFRLHFSPAQPQTLFKYTGPDNGTSTNVDVNYRFSSILGFGLLYGF